MEGASLGFKEGTSVGLDEGVLVGAFDGWIDGELVGSSLVVTVGLALGNIDGTPEGLDVAVGNPDGTTLGTTVGSFDNGKLGKDEGMSELKLGPAEGFSEQ